MENKSPWLLLFSKAVSLLLLELLYHCHFLIKIHRLLRFGIIWFLFLKCRELIGILFILDELECFQLRVSFLNLDLRISERLALYIKKCLLLRILLRLQVMVFFRISLILKRNSFQMIIFLRWVFFFLIYHYYFYYSLKNYFLIM